MKNYEQIDISGDAGLRIRGETIEELFENAALGASELMADTSKITETEKKDINLTAESQEHLLVIWLNELIFLFDAYGFIGRKFSVILKDNSLNAHVSGGTFDPGINEGRLLVKAATYNSLSLKKTGFGWEATVVFDI